MRFALIDRRKRHFPSIAYVGCLGSDKAAISPGGVGKPPAANATTWCGLVGLCPVEQTYGSPRMSRELRDSGLAVLVVIA